MESILEKLRCGNLLPNERSFQQGSKFHKVSVRLSDATETFLAALSPEQKKLFDTFDKAQFDLNYLTLNDEFIYGFRTGLLIGLEVSAVNEKFLVDGE